MQKEVHATEVADTIYLGGPILTIDDKAPRAEAVAVADGLILAVGGVTLPVFRIRCVPGWQKTQSPC